MNTCIKDNHGFSLVELVVTVLITAIISLMVMMFMSSSRSMYQDVSVSASLQEEALTVERILSEYIMEAHNFGFHEDLSIAGKMTDVFWVQANENNGGSILDKKPIYFFVFEKGENENTLKFCKRTEADKAFVDKTQKKYEERIVTGDGVAELEKDCFGEFGKYSLIAEHIDSVSMNAYKRDQDDSYMISLEIKFRYLDKEYTSRITAVTRNEKS